MQKSYYQSFLGQLIPSRRRSLTIPVPMMQGQQRLKVVLAKDIFLKARGWREPSRYYRGHITRNQLVLIGPRLYNQFYFRTHGRLTHQGDHIVLQLLIQLNHKSIYVLSLVSITAFLIAILLPTFGWGGLQLMPFYLGFFYRMVQWYLHYYSNEICGLLKDIITDSSINSGLEPEQEKESIRLSNKS